MSIPTDAKIVAAGVLPFFDNRKVVLLGKEYRKRYNCYNWMEFGGKHENNETLAETACREANEETAFTLNITLEQVLDSEKRNDFVDFFNPKTGVFYRMYCLDFLTKPTPEEFKANGVGKSNVEMVDYQYFLSKDVLHNTDGSLPETDVKIYETTRTRLAMYVNK